MWLSVVIGDTSLVEVASHVRELVVVGLFTLHRAMVCRNPRHEKPCLLHSTPNSGPKLESEM